MKQFLDALDKYSSDLKEAAVWDGLRKPFGNISDPAALEDSYVYEFYCYIRIICDLAKNYTLEYDSGSGTNADMFPQGPANKEGRPLFLIKDKLTHKVIYQVCAGTNIKLKDCDQDNAPDISFQDPHADMTEPTADQVKLIMDAKFDAEKVQSSEFNSFAVMVRNLEVERAEDEDIMFDDLKEFRGNCLISNKEAYRDDVAYLKKHHVTEVQNFNEDGNFQVITYIPSKSPSSSTVAPANAARTA